MVRRSAPWVLLGAAAAVAIAGACSSDDATGTSTPPACTEEAARPLNEVTIEDSTFSARCVRLTVGSKLRFVNNDAARAIVRTTAAAEEFDVVLEGRGWSASHTFTTVGRYEIVGDAPPGHVEAMTVLVVPGTG
jgi:plastocyanin